MSGFNEQDLIQFWKDANSYQNIDVACFNIKEFKDNWIRDKIGQEALEQANGAEKSNDQALHKHIVSGSNYCKQCKEPIPDGFLFCSGECKQYYYR